MTLICDTGPLIALAKINRLHLLHDLFEDVVIPDAVHDELLAKAGTESERISEAIEEFISVEATGGVADAYPRLAAPLGPGEQESISLATELGATLLMDDRRARIVARSLGIPLTGTIGVLLLAKSSGLLDAVRPALEECVREGYFLSAALITEALKIADEA